MHAGISRVVPSRESAYYVLATIRFQNASTRPWPVRRVLILWPGGRYKHPVTGLAIPPKSTREWTARIDPGAGDLGRLLAEPSAATVEVR